MRRRPNGRQDGDSQPDAGAQPTLPIATQQRRHEDAIAVKRATQSVRLLAYGVA